MRFLGLISLRQWGFSCVPCQELTCLILEFRQLHMSYLVLMVEIYYLLGLCALLNRLFRRNTKLGKKMQRERTLTQSSAEIEFTRKHLAYIYLPIFLYFPKTDVLQHAWSQNYMELNIIK